MNYNYIRNPLTNRNVRVNGQLGRKIIKRVKEMAGITLEWEIKILGE